MKRRTWILVHGILLTTLAALRTAPAEEHAPYPKRPLLPETVEHEELGTVHWNRDLDRVRRLSKESGKPVFILFQEVPGCSTCVNYGTSVLSHPLVAEAIETLFVPLVVFNNKGGKDAETLQRFDEPSWNNPVVRIVDFKGRALSDRVSRDYSISGTTGAMIAALERAGDPVPEYLRIVYEENASLMTPEVAYLSMFCFWAGEIDLGKIEGVVATRSGFMQGKEVVRVEYNPQVISFDQLVKKADRLSCARTVFAVNEEQRRTAAGLLGQERVLPASRFRRDSSVKYYLSKTAYRFLPVTGLQAVRVNRAVYERADPDIYLSPRQKAVLEVIRNSPGLNREVRHNAPGFRASWYQLLREISDTASARRKLNQSIGRAG